MKITNVRAVQPIGDGSPDDWRTSIGQILVAIDTDRGFTGYGVGGGGAAGIHVITTVLRELLLGRDPENIDSLWRAMYSATIAFGRKGLAIMAISGVDLALWDLRGKVAGQPIAKLLGGKTGESIPTYITVWDEVSAAQASEYDAFKLHVQPIRNQDDAETLTKLVADTRQEIGPAKQLMIDAWMQWDLDTTIDMSRRIEPFDIAWLEEPLPPDDLAGYETLVSRSALPIAGGEHEFTAAGFRPLIDGRLHHILQPDVCWCGGLTQLIEIYRLADAAGLRVCPHRGAEIWGLHAIAALDSHPLAESGRPWMNWVGGQPPIENGKIALTDEAGFGVQIDENRLSV